MAVGYVCEIASASKSLIYFVMHSQGSLRNLDEAFLM